MRVRRVKKGKKTLDKSFVFFIGFLKIVKNSIETIRKVSHKLSLGTQHAEEPGLA